ncbi:MAG: hypothetical protein EPN82_13145 [Bacteroidetes bacterium]|nr:MAG: hypothetical protein EPN82_13145 [Bacteroidota bacterium]
MESGNIFFLTKFSHNGLRDANSYSSRSDGLLPIRKRKSTDFSFTTNLNEPFALSAGAPLLTSALGHPKIYYKLNISFKYSCS